MDLKLFPFIIDHKAREGSTEEAELVSDRLQRLLGMRITGRDFGGGIDTLQA